jgi:hypothetical protein
VTLAPGELAALCYRRLHAWLTRIYTVSGGDPAYVRLNREPVQALPRHALVRYPNADSPLYRVESPRSGILSDRGRKLHVVPAQPVIVSANVGLAALTLQVDDFGTDRHRVLLEAGSHLREAARLDAMRALPPVPTGPEERGRALVELADWLAAQEPA